ncbi:MAG: flagellar basal body rod protein FlgB [Lautropia sp.]
MTEAIDFHGKALQLRAQRQAVLSSNIATADTPGYKARDFDVAAELRQAAGQPGGAGAGAAGGGAAVPGGPGASGSVAAAGATTLRLATPSLASASASMLARSQPGHLGGVGAAAGGHEVSTRAQYVTPEQGTLDGNTVDLNRERAQFADNALRYEATLRFINSRMRTMMTAIRGE